MAKSGRKNDIDGLLARMAKSKVVVVGDVILDRFVYGTVERISPEAPVPVVDVQHTARVLGGAANVVRNLRSLGADALLVGVVGADGPARTLHRLLEKDGASSEGLVEVHGRQTAVKTRIIAQKQQVVRFDRESKGALPGETAGRLGDAVARALKGAHAVIVSDYGKGVVSAELMAQLAAHTTEAGIPLAVDPKPQNRALYHGVGIITPNVKETEAMCALSVSTDAEAEAAGFALLRKLDTRAILVTRGEKGMTLVERGKKKAVHIPTRARDVFDVTGAGDTAISVLTLAWAAGADLATAAMLANCAGGVVVGKLGTAVVSPEELRKAAADLLP
jgi:D-beta-D-heptose 7-phosphate kinase/D-beta-D-heptose 1-phosphate adenosyltransferase